jgi:hypothetical protein
LCGRSGQHLLHDVAVHVGQAEVAALEAVRQARVVEAEQAQDRRVQVVDGGPAPPSLSWTRSRFITRFLVACTPKTPGKCRASAAQNQL